MAQGLQRQISLNSYGIHLTELPAKIGIDALVFDFDGVIIDTETPDYESWAEEFETHGVKLSRSLWSKFIGGAPNSFDICAHLSQSTSTELDLDSIQYNRRRKYLGIVEASPLLPGVLDYLTQARNLGLKVGVASSSSHSWVRGHLERRGLLEYVDIITSRDDVIRVKPWPDLFTTTLRQLKSSPLTSLAIEDSANGVTAAKRAGLFCVVVPNRMTHDLPLDHADLRLDSLLEVDLKTLLRLATNPHRT